MDRRNFLQRTGVLAASAGALAVTPAAPVRATATAATVPRAAAAPTSLQLAYLQGSAQGPSPGRGVEPGARWVRWTGGRTVSRAQGGLRDVRVLEMRRGAAAAGFARLDILSRHTVAGMREPVEFFAWGYVRDRAGGNSAPVTFAALASGNAELLVDYRVDGFGAATGAGRVLLPIGSPGLRDGIYALLSPRASDGRLPDPRALASTGDPAFPLACADGSVPDFDHLIVSIAPAIG